MILFVSECQSQNMIILGRSLPHDSVGKAFRTAKQGHMTANSHALSSSALHSHPQLYTLILSFTLTAFAVWSNVIVKVVSRLNPSFALLCFEKHYCVITMCVRPESC